jgi:hypothetical protein
MHVSSIRLTPTQPLARRKICLTLKHVEEQQGRVVRGQPIIQLSPSGADSSSPSS